MADNAILRMLASVERQWASPIHQIYFPIWMGLTKCTDIIADVVMLRIRDLFPYLDRTRKDMWPCAALKVPSRKSFRCMYIVSRYSPRRPEMSVSTLKMCAHDLTTLNTTLEKKWNSGIFQAEMLNQIGITSFNQLVFKQQLWVLLHIISYHIVNILRMTMADKSMENENPVAHVCNWK